MRSCPSSSIWTLKESESRHPMLRGILQIDCCYRYFKTGGTRLSPHLISVDFSGRVQRLLTFWIMSTFDFSYAHVKRRKGTGRNCKGPLTGVIDILNGSVSMCSRHTESESSCIHIFRLDMCLRVPVSSLYVFYL